MADSYFDEAYFQRGWERGTAYVDYKTGAAESLIFKNVAQAVAAVFKPTRVLEIGCATGAIVAELNRIGVEAHGIDVSAWAVEHSLHPNVKLASADNLPFADGEFDLLISSHALEHIPIELSEAAFREMQRVCSPHASQFHMLPIIGTYPYDGDPELAIYELRKDPTHVLLNDKQWWLGRWQSDWSVVPLNIHFEHDTDNGELSSGQFFISRKSGSELVELMTSVGEWNGNVLRNCKRSLAKLQNDRTEIIHVGKGSLVTERRIGPNGGEWDDISVEFPSDTNVRDATFEGVVSVGSDGPRQLRFAILDGQGRAAQKWFTFEPGLSRLSFNFDDAIVDEGFDWSVNEMRFGGIIGHLNLSLSLAARNGPTQTQIF